jgi:hypothetical protein
MGFVRRRGAGQAWSIIELVNSAHALDSELAKTKPRKRGRRSNAHLEPITMLQ